MNTGNYIYSKLSAAASVTALVETRIYPMIMPQSAAYPSVVYQVSNRPTDRPAKDLASDHDTATVTFNIWADVKYGQDAYTALDGIDSAVRAVLDYQSGTAGGVTCEACKYLGSEDIFSEDRLLIGRSATYQLTIKNV